MNNIRLVHLKQPTGNCHMLHFIPQKCSGKKKNVARILRLCCGQFGKRQASPGDTAVEIVFEVRLPGGKVLINE